VRHTANGIRSQDEFDRLKKMAMKQIDSVQEKPIPKMKWMRWIIICPALLWLIGVVDAPRTFVSASEVQEDADCKLVSATGGRVTLVVDGETVTLDDGRTVRLIGAMAPRAPDWWKKPEPWPPAELARKALSDLVLGHDVALLYGGRKEDRHARQLAHLFVDRGDERIWVQSSLIERGFSRAYSFQGNRMCIRPLQARENSAREAKLGLWWRKTYAVLDAGRPKSIFPRMHTFQIVEGTVRGVKKTKRWTFVNFGADWKRDFTIAVKAKNRRLFAKSDLVLSSLRGRRIRVRGWIESWNGPAIKVTHPEEIEILDQTPSSVAPKKQNPAPRAPGSVEL